VLKNSYRLLQELRKVYFIYPPSPTRCLVRDPGTIFKGALMFPKLFAKHGECPQQHVLLRTEPIALMIFLEGAHGP
jgi:hypothetical protein